MSDPPQLQVLDFTSPRKPRRRQWRALSRWHESLCILTTEAWSSLLNGEVILSPGAIQPHKFRNAVGQFPDECIAIQLEISSERLTSLVIFSKKQLHGLLADLLSIAGEEWPDIRDFTLAESSMLMVLFEAFSTSIANAIPGAEPTTCELLRTIDKPHRTRLFAQEDDVFVNEIEIKSRFGEDVAYWLTPKVRMEELLGEEAHEFDDRDHGIQPQLEALAERIEVDVVVELGQCDVTMSQVSELSVGDVLVLDQPIHRPLSAYVAGERKWLGQPLKIGPRQGFEIVELLFD